MELWIRSQNKTEIMKVIDLDIFDNGEPISYFIESRGIILGEYKSKERTMEVLNEIEERISLINTISLIKNELMLKAMQNALGEDKIKGLSYPYQMPEE